jgi:hypothetical protein
VPEFGFEETKLERLQPFGQGWLVSEITRREIHTVSKDSSVGRYPEIRRNIAGDHLEIAVARDTSRRVEQHVAGSHKLVCDIRAGGLWLILSARKLRQQDTLVGRVEHSRHVACATVLVHYPQTCICGHTWRLPRDQKHVYVVWNMFAFVNGPRFRETQGPYLACSNTHHTARGKSS